MAVIDLPELAIDNVANYGDDDDETRRQREAQRLALARLSEGALGDDESSSSRPAMPSYAESAARVAPHEVAPQDIAGARRTPGPSDANASRVLAQSSRERQAASPAVTANPQAARLAEQGLKLLRSSGDKSDPEAAMRRAQGERSSNRSRDAILNFASMFFGGSGRALDGGPDPVAALEEQRRAAIQAEQERATAASRAAEAATHARQGEMADPRSGISDAYRAVVRDMFPGRFSEDALAQMSAADFAGSGLMSRLTLGEQRGQQQAANTAAVGANQQANIAATGEQARETEGVRQEGRMDLAEVNNAARMDLQRLRNEIRGRLRRSGGSGGGRGGAAPSLEQLQAAYIDAMKENGTTLSDEQLQLRASVLSTRDLGAVIRTEGTSTTGGGVRGEQASDRAEQRSQIPGWRRTAGAPEIEAAEARRLRDANASWNEMRPMIRRLGQLAGEMTASDAAGAMVGYRSERMAEAMQLQEQVVNMLRDLGNYGVPTGNELARMEALANTLESPRGIANASTMYRALERALGQRVADRITSYGFEPDSGGGGGGSDTVRVRHNGVERRVSRANLQRALADGAEVIE